MNIKEKFLRDRIIQDRKIKNMKGFTIYFARVIDECFCYAF